MNIEEPQLASAEDEIKPPLEDPVAKRREMEENITEFLKAIGIPESELEQQHTFINELVAYGMADDDEKVSIGLISFLRSFFKEDNLIAAKLIETGAANILLENISMFPDVNKKLLIEQLLKDRDYDDLADNLNILVETKEQQAEIGQSLLEKGAYVVLIKHLKDFPQTDELVLAEKLIESEDVYFLTKHLTEIAPAKQAQIIDRLINTKNVYSLASEYPEYSADIQQLIINKLETQNKYKELIRFLEFLPENKHEEIAQKLIDSQEASALGSYLKNFKNLSSAIASQLILNDQTYYVADNISSFRPQAHTVIALELCKTGKALYLFDSWSNFIGLDKREIFKTLLELRGMRVENLDLFRELIDQDTALALLLVDFDLINHLAEFPQIDQQRLLEDFLAKVGSKYLYMITNNLDKLKIDHNKLAIYIINSEGVWYLDKLNNFNKSVLLALLEKNQFQYIFDNIGKFSEFDANLVAEKILASGLDHDTLLLAENLDKILLPDDVYVDIAERLLAQHNGRTVLMHINNFHGIKAKDIVDKMLAMNDGANVIDFVKYAPEFSMADIIEKMVDNNDFNGVDRALNLPADLDYVYIDKLLWENSWFEIILKHLDKLPGLDREKARKIIDRGMLGALRSLTMNLDKVALQAADYADLADKLLANRDGGYLCKYFNYFKGVDQLSISAKLLIAKQGADIVDNIKNFSELSLPDLMKKMLVADDMVGVERLLNLKAEYDYSEIAKNLMEKKWFTIILHHLKELPDIDQQDLIWQLLEQGEYFELNRYFDEFAKIDKSWLYQELIQRASYKDIAISCLAVNYKKLDISNQTLAEDLAAKGKIDRFLKVIKEDKNFADLDIKSLGQKVLAAGDYVGLAENMEFFPDIDEKLVTEKLLETTPLVLVANLEKFKDIDQNRLMRKCLELASFNSAADCSLEKFKNLDNEIAEMIIQLYPDGMRAVIKNWDTFRNIKENKVLATMVEKFNSDYLTRTIYVYCKDIYEKGARASVAEEFKIKSSGEAGLNELMRYFRKFTRELVYEFSNQKLQEELKNNVLHDYFKAITHYTSSDWGSHGDQDFSQTIENYFAADFTPMPAEYQASEEVRIKKVDQEAIDNFKHTDDFLKLYDEIIKDIRSAQVLSLEPEGSQLLQFKLKEAMEKTLARLRANLKKQTNPKAIENLQQTIKDIDDLNFSGPVDFESLLNLLQNISILAKGEEGKDLRQLIRINSFYANFKINEGFINQDFDSYAVQKPTMTEVSTVIDFIEHIVNKENLKEFFTNKKAVKNFSDIVNSRELQETLQRWQNQGNKGTSPLQFVPCRNIFTEFSGHLADACWASKYPSILKEFPNFTTLLFIQNPENEKNFNIAGASFLIEAESEEGEPVMIIRGLNPRENVINQLAVEDFIAKLLAYLKPIAQKRGLKKIIIPLTGSGSSMTNRPVIAGHLNNILADKPIVKLAPEPKTQFNGYDISSNCHLLAEVV